MVHIIDTYHERQATGMKAGRAKIFWTGRSQAVRLPKEYRFETDTVRVHREGAAVILEPVHDWPEGYVESFTGAPEDFRRPAQGKVDEREKLP
jgi:antitoxin VapB